MSFKKLTKERKVFMRKSLRFLVIALVMISMMSCMVFADYSECTIINGTRYETEPNDVEDDATILDYPLYGTIADVADSDYYVYFSGATQTRTLRWGYNTSMNVAGAEGYLYLLDLTDDNLIYAQNISLSSSKTVQFNAIAGHIYIIEFNLNGPSDAIQDRLDYLYNLNGFGYRYVIRVAE